MSVLSDYLARHWLGGVAWLGSTITAFSIGYFPNRWGENHRIKIRRREEHAEDIKREVLRPIYEHLQRFYLPICRMEMSPLEVGRMDVNRKKLNSVTEDAYLRTEHCIKIKPAVAPPLLGTVIVYDRWPETEGFLRYFGDALEYHYPVLLKKWRNFDHEHSSLANAAKIEAESLIPGLAKAINLPHALACYRGSQPAFRANYQRLALLVFHHRNEIGREGALYARSEDSGTESVLAIVDSFSESVAWCQGPQEKDRIIDIIDGMIEDAAPNNIASWKKRFQELGAAAEKLIGEIDFSLAQKPRLIKCPMVE